MESSSAIFQGHSRAFQQPATDVFSFENIEIIKTVFQSRKLSAAQDHEFTELCFQKILKACKKGEWAKVEMLGNAILGLEHNGRNLYQAYIEEGEEIEVVEFIKNKQQLVAILSNGEYRYGMHYAASGKRSERIFEALEIRASSYDFPKLGLENVCKRVYNFPNLHDKCPIHCAIESGSVDSLKVLISKNVSLFVTFLDPKTSIYFSPATFAVYKGSIACFDLLMDQGQINLRDELTSQGTILHLALLNDQTEMFEHLLTKHIDKTLCFITKKNIQRKTPLMIAASRGNIEAIVLLSRLNIDLEDRDDKGRTALHCAVIENQIESIQFLIGVGAITKSIDIYGQIPIQYIHENGTNSYCIKEIFSKAAKVQKEFKYHRPNYTQTPPDTLIFKGGGAKGS